MDKAWQREFGQRIERFVRKERGLNEGIPVSIKVRVTSGCFHREHSTHAYEIIDRAVRQQSPSQSEFLEHESGPELLVYLAVAAAGITLAKSVIDLITTIIKARSEGVKKGDKPSDPIELIVRRVDDARKVTEEVVLRITHTDSVDSKVIEKQLTNALQKLTKGHDSSSEPD